MRMHLNEPPRTFRVGIAQEIEIRDVGTIRLEPDEQVTFETESGCRHDFARKEWGFYATPSINRRLVDEGFRTALVESEGGRIYLMVVEAARVDLFDQYCERERQTVLRWLDEHPSGASTDG